MNINFAKQVPTSLPSLHASPRQTTLFELLVLLVIGALFFWFVASPKAAKLSEQKNLAASLVAESGELGLQQKKLEGLIVQLKDSASDIGKLDEALPLHPRTTWMYLLVQSMVESTGMTVSSLSVSNAGDEFMAGSSAILVNPFSASRGLKRMGVNLATTGSFAQFQALLKKIESSSRLMDIKVLEMSASSDNLLDFRMAFDAYYFGAVN